MPKAFMREAKVEGVSPRRFAASFSPATIHPVSSRARRRRDSGKYSVTQAPWVPNTSARLRTNPNDS